MAKILLTSKTVDRSKVKKANERVEDNSIELDKLVDEISAPYIGEVDKVMESARKKALAGEFSDYDLDILSLQIPVLLYWASEGQEQSGIRNDISKAIAKQKFNEHYESRATGTIADKTAASELNSMDEQLSQIVYNRTYRMISAKVEAATEFVQSMKRVISRRITEKNLTRLNEDGNREGDRSSRRVQGRRTNG